MRELVKATVFGIAALLVINNVANTERPSYEDDIFYYKAPAPVYRDELKYALKDMDIPRPVPAPTPAPAPPPPPPPVEVKVEVQSGKDDSIQYAVVMAAAIAIINKLVDLLFDWIKSKRLLKPSS